ncbi:MAG TPA: hypothetical protein VFD78_02490 [Chitinophagaceae bacterium]|nr:hypothetical protein [Chitinophagaceae bacterium]
MKELIKELVEKTGLSEEMAEKAVATMMSFVKNKLPEGMSGQVENILNGDFDLSSLFGGGDDKSDSGSNPLDALKGFLDK